MFEFKIIGPTGEVEQTYTIPGSDSALLAEMAAMYAPRAVRGWVQHNGTHRPLKWTYDAGRRTVRVTRTEK